MNRLYISAAHKSSGKTTLAIGLCAALSKRGLTVQPFKKGPDYIDPMWLSAAAGRVCWNLDFHTQSSVAITDMVLNQSSGTDVVIIEGNKGLHDGVDPVGSDSSAALAKLVEAGVLLIIDSTGITRGIAPLLLGYKNFDPEVSYIGVILNKVANLRHERKLRNAIEHYVGIPVLGSLPRTENLSISERHLGLTSACEVASIESLIANICSEIEQHINVTDLLIAIGVGDLVTNLPDCTVESTWSSTVPSKELAISRKITTVVNSYKEGPVPSYAIGSIGSRVRIAIASDAAFCFYYPDDIFALESAGAELVFFDTMRDSVLPSKIDGIFIGGGFPEMYMSLLESNIELRLAIQAALVAGLPAYAECGGLMYLSRCITWHGQTHSMVGFIPADAVMYTSPRGRGYVHLEETSAMPWPGEQTAFIHAAHEFHYSGLENLGPEVKFAYNVIRGKGITGRQDGIVLANTLATYTHMRSVGSRPWAGRFISFVKNKKV